MNFLIKFNLDLDSRSRLKSIVAQFSLSLDKIFIIFNISHRVRIPSEFHAQPNADLQAVYYWWPTSHVTKSCDKICVRRSLIGSKSSWIIGSYVDIIAVQEVRVLGGHLKFRQSDSIEQIRNYNFIKMVWLISYES